MTTEERAWKAWTDQGLPAPAPVENWPGDNPPLSATIRGHAVRFNERRGAMGGFVIGDDAAFVPWLDLDGKQVEWMVAEAKQRGLK